MCQACQAAPVEQQIRTGGEEEPVRLCNACAERFENHALRPLEYYRLAALHGLDTYLLSDDFYDEDGEASQPWIPVEQAELLGAPDLPTVSKDLAALLDYALTRWSLEEDVISALRTHPADALLTSIANLVEERPSSWIENRCYEIAARVLGREAREWISSRWDIGAAPGTMFAFLEAAAACLPPSEAVPRALDAVFDAVERWRDEDGRAPDLSQTALALARFRSAHVLDWMEEHVRSPVSDRWGLLAAYSGFTWSRATQWMEAGRPLSLVAIDALATILSPHHAGLPPSLSDPPNSLPDAPPPMEIMKRLREQAVVDPAPRVTETVERIARSIATTGGTASNG